MLFRSEVEAVELGVLYEARIGSSRHQINVEEEDLVAATAVEEVVSGRNQVIAEELDKTTF